MGLDRWSAGAAWLAMCAPEPDTVREAWAANELAAIPADRWWTVVETPLIGAMEPLGELSRAGRLGPVLAYPAADRAWWLVSRDAEEHLADVRQVMVRPEGWLLRCPEPGYVAGGRFWIEDPDGRATLTDPRVLGAAFGPYGRLPAGAFG